MAKGFYWGANNPYLRSIWFKVRRAPKGLNPSIMLIGPDANPAGIIFECMTNRDWGMGAGIGTFDVPSFETAAQTLYDEGFGLSLLWTSSTTIEAFITEIIDHIHATLFVNPRTGLITLRLLRDDFAVETLRVISPDNAKLTNFQRKMWGETANEIVVTFTNPDNEKDETVAAQDLANISMQGGIVSNGRNYYAIRNRDLAARVAERDLRAMSQPLCTAQVEMDRSAWDVLPGEPMVLTWPEKGIDQVIVRAGVVDYGGSSSGTIKFGVHEDVFSLTRAEYLSPPETGWVDPSKEPLPLSKALLLTAPTYITARDLALDTPESIAYPEVIALPLAQVNDSDDIDYELIGQTTQSNGDLVYTSFGTRAFVAGALLSDAIDAEVETEIATFDSPTGASPAAGTLLLIGDGGDQDVEVALVQEVTETGWTLARGVLDTVPRAWPAGTQVWSLPNDVSLTDTTLRAEGETVEYRLLTRTSKGVLPFEDATPEAITLTARPHLPSRPANVAVGGVTFGTLDVAGMSQIPISWANRNRLLETTQILKWSEPDIGGEVGQTTRISVLDDSGNVVNALGNLSGTDFALTIDALDGLTSGFIRVSAERDGLESLQGHQVAFTNAPSVSALSGSVVAASTLSGNLSMGIALSGSAYGDGNLSGELDATAVLSGDIFGDGTLSGQLDSSATLTGGISTAGVLTANLTVTP